MTDCAQNLDHILSTSQEGIRRAEETAQQLEMMQNMLSVAIMCGRETHFMYVDFSSALKHVMPQQAPPHHIRPQLSLRLHAWARTEAAEDPAKNAEMALQLSDELLE